MDEKLMVREQDRLAKEKRKKKYRKRKIAAAVVTGCLIIGSIWYVGWGRNLKPEVENVVQIETSAGQKIIYADLTAVKGNEIMYLVAKEQDTAEDATEEDTPYKDQMPDMSKMPGGGEMPDMSKMPDRSQMPGGGEMPDMSKMPGGGEMPDMSKVPGGGEMPDMSQMFGGRGNEDGMFSEEVKQSSVFTYNDVVYEVTDESVTTMIPVGTDVITKLGNVTTFSRLAAGDKVALVVEEEQDRQVIVAVYIIG